MTTIRPLDADDDLTPEIDLRHRAFGPIDGVGSLVKAVSAGDGAASPGAVALGSRGFSALFAGVPMATLRVAGLAARGDQATDSMLDCAFGCVPFMIDVF